MKLDAQKVVVAAIREVKGDAAPSHIDPGDSLVLRLGFDSMNIALLSMALEKECGYAIALDGWIMSATNPEGLTVASLSAYIEDTLGDQAPAAISPPRRGGVGSPT